MCCLQVFIKIGTIDSFIKHDAKDRVNRSREIGTGLANEVNHVALIK